MANMELHLPEDENIESNKKAVKKGAAKQFIGPIQSCGAREKALEW